MKLIIRGEEIKVNEFVKRFVIDPIELDNDSGSFFHYIIDIYSDGSMYFPKVYRSEFFRLTPSFSSTDNCDEELFVEDMSRQWEEISRGSPAIVLDEVLKTISDIFELDGR